MFLCLKIHNIRANHIYKGFCRYFDTFYTDLYFPINIEYNNTPHVPVFLSDEQIVLWVDIFDVLEGLYPQKVIENRQFTLHNRFHCEKNTNHSRKLTQKLQLLVFSKLVFPVSFFFIFYNVFWKLCFKNYYLIDFFL